MTSTTRNFAISAVFFLSLLALVLWKDRQPKGCDSAKHTTLILLDFTDPLGKDAISTAKEYVWEQIEKSPAFSRIIFKEIRGTDPGLSEAKNSVLELCRKNTPSDITNQFKGATKPVEKEWNILKDRVCGHGDPKASLSCSSPNRTADGFLDVQAAPSASSPILESTVDAAREYLTTREQSWTMIVISDWKQYGSSLNLHTQKCDMNAPPDFRKVPFLADPNRRAFSVRGTPANQSKVVSLFAVRSSMTNDEANCLQQFSEKFLNSQLQASRLIDAPEIIRLPKSP